MAQCLCDARAIQIYGSKNQYESGCPRLYCQLPPRKLVDQEQAVQGGTQITDPAKLVRSYHMAFATAHVYHRV